MKIGQGADKTPPSPYNNLHTDTFAEYVLLRTSF